MNASSMNPNDPAGTESGPQAEPQRPSGPYSPPPVPRQNFFDWIRSHGMYRGQDRWIGGVASGIAHRMGIDPLIVRGIFIVLALFAGIGILVYGLAWAFLPEPDGRIHVQEAGNGGWAAGMTGALITTIIGLPGLGRGFWGWGPDGGGFAGFVWALFWIGAIVALIYFLVQRNRNRNGAVGMNAQQFAGTPMAGPYQYGGNPYGPNPYAPTPTDAATPYDADKTDEANKPKDPGQPGDPMQFGAAPTASLPAGGYPQGPGYPQGLGYPQGPGYPSGPVPPQGGGYGGGFPGAPARPPRPRRLGPGAGTVAVFAGAALLVGGIIKALDAGNVIELGAATNAVVFASGAAVLGLGILFAGLRGRTSGFLGFLAAVALIIGAIFNVVPNGDRFNFHNTDWTPSSIEQARSGLDISGGRGTVDLRSTGAVAPMTSDVVVPLDVTASNVTVIIPSNIPVEVKADMAFGNLHQGGNSMDGRRNNVSRNYNADAPGSKMVVEINGAFSNITIQEGN